MGRRIRLVGVALAAALALAACGGGEETPTQAAPSASSPLVVDDGTLAAGAKIAAPKGEVVLTMTGDIGAANKGKKLELDLASLESMRRVRLEAAERALRASEERFRSLVQNSSDVISIVDADGAVRYHSESVRRVLGYDPGELVDGDPLSLVHPDDRERVARFVAEAALRPGVTPAESWRVRHRDGTWLHSETVAANLLEDPNARGLALNTRDVSDRKEPEAQLVHQASTAA